MAKTWEQLWQAFSEKYDALAEYAKGDDARRPPTPISQPSAARFKGGGGGGGGQQPEWKKKGKGGGEDEKEGEASAEEGNTDGKGGKAKGGADEEDAVEEEAEEEEELPAEATMANVRGNLGTRSLPTLSCSLGAAPGRTDPSWARSQRRLPKNTQDHWALTAEWPVLARALEYAEVPLEKRPARLKKRLAAMDGSGAGSKSRTGSASGFFAGAGSTARTSIVPPSPGASSPAAADKTRAPGRIVKKVASPFASTTSPRMWVDWRAPGVSPRSWRGPKHRLPVEPGATNVGSAGRGSPRAPGRAGGRGQLTDSGGITSGNTIQSS